MTYVAAIFDRTQADITAQNSKAFLSVGAWVRVYGNLLEVNTAIATALGVAIAFRALSTPTTATIPTITELNELAANIERLRLFGENITEFANDPDFVGIKDDWIAGQSNPSPIFTNVNSWEKVLDIIYQVYKTPYTVERPPITGVAICGAGNLGFE